MIRALIVDDEPMQLQGLLRHIDWERLGYVHPLTAESGEEALAILGQTPVDVLITDVAMPGMSGIELLSACAVDYPGLQSLQTLIISGYDEFEFVQEAIHLGVKGYLLKPIKTQLLEEKLDAFRVTIEKKRRLERETSELRLKLSSSLDIVHDKFVNDLINGRLPTEEAAASWDRLLGLPPEDWKVRIIVFRCEEEPLPHSVTEGRVTHGERLLQAVKAGFAECKHIYVGRTGPNEATAVELNASPEQRAKAEKQLIFVKDVLRQQCDAAVEVVVSAACHDWREAPRMYREASDALAAPVATSAAQRQEDASSMAPDEPITQHRLIRSIAHYLEEHLQDHVTVKQLAERFHLNASYLSVLFKKETGRTISDFVQEARMNKARELLQDPGVKVYEVASCVGFQTTAYFSYLFKKRMGVTPQEYRDYR